jgi:gliding motility-associated-like protein
MLSVPNAFTPNQDGKNDVFKAIHGDNVTSFMLQIYNRWGQLCFETRDIKKGWNGFMNGQKQSAGVYVWLIRYKIPEMKDEKVLKGTVNLIW